MAVVDKYTIGSLASSLSCLIEFKKYSEEMRKIGRGASVVGLFGEDVDGAIAGLTSVLKELIPEVLDSDDLPEHITRFVSSL